jgi:serine/threonine protein kinase
MEEIARKITADKDLSKESLSRIGQSIGRYQIRNELGKGGMGEVYQGRRI